MASATAPAATGAPPSELRSALLRIAPADRVLTRPIDVLAFAADASFYRLIPKAVVLATGIEEIQALFRFSHERRIPLTFRAAGTSLSGQAITDGVLVEAARHWRGAKVEDGGKKVRVQPGIIGGHVNLLLRSYGVKMGPDPASINACMMGGILANNSSGMCCGVAQNAYHTLDSLTFVLPSGTIVNTAEPGAEERFRSREPRLAQGILDLKSEIDANSVLRDRIRSKYRMKNTTGYSLNAFVDFERPLDIFQHLLIGSEGTLAFIAEAVLNTVPDLPVKYTGLLLFPDLYAACAAIVPLRDAGAKALELMDRASLRSVENEPGIPPSIKNLAPDAAGLLAEFQSANLSERAAIEQQARDAVHGLRLVEPARFTFDPAEQAQFWKIRQGLYPAVGAVRKSGTTVIIEDVAFPVERLADATIDLTKLFAKHGYDNGIIFGHAKDGNLHFIITQSFNDQAAIDTYARFLDDVVRLVVDRYDGALKAEHGTGRNMAPFVEKEWGAEAYRIMKRLKDLADPENLLNPGVIINPDPESHLRALKPTPSIEEEVDKCIECGFCEVKCPSRDLTTTPRQRIVLRREMARLRNGKANRAMLDALIAEFPYTVLDTCATDGLCATACPVGIDTGQLTKRLRRLRHSATAHSIAGALADNFAATERAIRFALRLGHGIQSIFGAGAMAAITGVMRSLTRNGIPKWTPDVPRPAKRLPSAGRAGAQAVYFPSCISRVMGRIATESAELSISEAFLAVAARAGLPLFIPDDVAGTCCGVPFSSKGYDQAHDIAANAAIERLWRWSDEGRLPVVVDTSPCTYGLLTCRELLNPENQKKFDSLNILDGV
ncbi:MAG TPA: FAD-binding and (Fe-S)-binding domain-containing protein, partial [Candidatus Acidoferrales bacterium]|nr:FAD-binding and (Fe-S)-binding domain-containing protein [Candidatus Acidoferrales bacterium]